MAEPLASTDDVAALWRPLSDAEETVATSLIRVASRIIRTRWADVDDRVTAGALDPQDVADVVASMVKRSMLVGDAEGLESQSQGAGPFSVSNKFANPNGNLYLIAEEIRMFEPDGYNRHALVGWLA